MQLCLFCKIFIELILQSRVDKILQMCKNDKNVPTMRNIALAYTLSNLFAKKPYPSKFLCNIIRHRYLCSNFLSLKSNYWKSALECNLNLLMPNHSKLFDNLKILQHLFQDFWSVSDDFGILSITGFDSS